MAAKALFQMVVLEASASVTVAEAICALGKKSAASKYVESTPIREELDKMASLNAPYVAFAANQATIKPSTVSPEAMNPLYMPETRQMPKIARITMSITFMKSLLPFYGSAMVYSSPADSTMAVFALVTPTTPSTTIGN